MYPICSRFAICSFSISGRYIPLGHVRWIVIVVRLPLLPPVCSPGSGRCVMPLVYIVGAIVPYAPIRLITDNVLYAAIIRRLKAEFGIEEDSVLAVVTTNLVPILITLALIALIYKLATAQNHAP